MSGSTLTPEQQDALANKAQRDATTGEWYVNTIGGERMNVSDVKESDLSSILSNDNDEKAIQYAQNTMSYVEKIEATTKQIDAKLGMLTFSNFAQMSKEQMENSLNAFGKYSADIQEAIEANRYDATAEQKAMLDGLKGINTQYRKERNITELFKNEKPEDASYVAWRESENRAGNTHAAYDEASEKFVQAKKEYDESSGFDAIGKWYNKLTARAAVNRAQYKDNWNNADGFWNKIGSIITTAVSSNIDDDTIQRQYELRQKYQNTIIEANGEPVAVPANKVTPIHDGVISFAKPDSKDSAIFAKPSGPFDTLFNGIFDKINDMYGMFSDGMEHNDELSTPYLLPVPTAHDNVLPLPTTDRNYLTKSPYPSNSQNSQWGNSGKGQFDVNVRGEINLKANGQTIDILRQLQEDPLLVRAITQMISESIASQKSGGRAPYGGYRW